MHRLTLLHPRVSSVFMWHPARDKWFLSFKRNAVEFSIKKKKNKKISTGLTCIAFEVVLCVHIPICCTCTCLHTDKKMFLNDNSNYSSTWMNFCLKLGRMLMLCSFTKRNNMCLLHGNSNNNF